MYGMIAYLQCGIPVSTPGTFVVVFFFRFQILPDTHLMLSDLVLLLCVVDGKASIQREGHFRHLQEQAALAI